jgi:hypothetical protein
MASRFDSLEDYLASLDPVKPKTISAAGALLTLAPLLLLLFGGLYLFVLPCFAK